MATTFFQQLKGGLIQQTAVALGFSHGIINSL
jgi:hypothetical protein